MYLIGVCTVKYSIRLIGRYIKSCTTQLKINNLFWLDENSIEQCFAGHIACARLSTILFNIVTPDCRLVQAQQLVQYC